MQNIFIDAASIFNDDPCTWSRNTPRKYDLHTQWGWKETLSKTAMGALGLAAAYSSFGSSVLPSTVTDSVNQALSSAASCAPDWATDVASNLPSVTHLCLGAVALRATQIASEYNGYMKGARMEGDRTPTEIRTGFQYKRNAIKRLKEQKTMRDELSKSQ